MELEVEKLLKEKGIDYKLMPLSGKVVRYEDVKKYAKGVDPENDCKTIVTKDEQGNIYAFMLRGMVKIDFRKVKGVVGRKVKILSPEDLKEVTGKEPGEVCPLLLRNMKIYVDKRIFERDKIDFSAGDPRFGLEISTEDFKKALDFEMTDIAQE